MGAEAKSSGRQHIEKAIAHTLYRNKTKTLQRSLESLTLKYSSYLTSLNEVRQALAQELSQDVSISEDIIRQRREETLE